MRNRLPLPAQLLIDEEQLLAEMPSPPVTGSPADSYTAWLAHTGADLPGQQFTAGNSQNTSTSPTNEFLFSVACFIMNGLLKKSVAFLSTRKVVYYK